MKIRIINKGVDGGYIKRCKNRMALKEKEVVGIGALNYDVLYVVERMAGRGEEVGIIDINKAPGGSAANTIVALARLGVDTGFVGVVGNDNEGDIIMDTFRREGVDTMIKRVDGSTGAAIGFIDSKGERTLYIYPGVNDKLRINDIDMEFVANSKYVHISSFVNRAQLDMLCEVATQLKESKSKLSFSPGMLCSKYELADLRTIIERSEVVFLSENELESLISGDNYEHRASKLLDIGASIICVTLGERGCYVANRACESHLVEAYPTDVVDTTGAGDAFAAGFLYGLLHSKSIYECARAGNLLASYCIRRYGSRNGLPYSLTL